MQNFNQLFPQNTNQHSPKTIRLLRGELTLFKRPNSHQWQCRFKLPNGKWHVASTATDDLDAAQTQAVGIYETVKVKVGAGLALVTKTFKQVAQPNPVEQRIPISLSVAHRRQDAPSPLAKDLQRFH